MQHLTFLKCRYSMILFAGIAAEALIYGEAEGGENDENLFRSLCILLNPPLSVAQVCIPLNVPLRYPLRFGGSQSYILDPSPSVEPSSITNLSQFVLSY